MSLIWNLRKIDCYNGHRSLWGYSPRSLKQADMAKPAQTQIIIMHAFGFSNTSSVNYDQNCWFYLTYLGKNPVQESVALDMLKLKKNILFVYVIYWLQSFIFWNKVSTNSVKTWFSTLLSDKNFINLSELCLCHSFLCIYILELAYKCFFLLILNMNKPLCSIKILDYYVVGSWKQYLMDIIT